MVKFFHFGESAKFGVFGNHGTKIKQFFRIFILRDWLKFGVFLSVKLIKVNIIRTKSQKFCYRWIVQNSNDKFAIYMYIWSSHGKIVMVKKRNFSHFLVKICIFPKLCICKFLKFLVQICRSQCEINCEKNNCSKNLFQSKVKLRSQFENFVAFFVAFSVAK